MDDFDSLGQRYSTKIEVIRDYLSAELAATGIRQSEDFDRDGIVLRTGRGIESGFRLFISHEFLSDFTEQGIATRLRSWRVSDRVKALKPGFTLFVTTEGTFAERTEGRTVREVTGTFESVLPQSERRRQLYDRVFAIRIDGKQLGETRTEFQGDSELYINYSDDFAQALGTAYLLDAAGLRRFELRTQPYLRGRGIDFEVLLPDGARVFLDFKRALSPRTARDNALREQINVALRRAMRDDSAVRDAIEGYFVQVTIPTAPTDKTQVVDAISELLRFTVSTNWKVFVHSSFVPFDADKYPMLATLGATVYVAQGSTYLSVVEGATGFNPYAVYGNVARIIERESHREFGVAPVWLCVSLADVAGLLPSEDMVDPRWSLMFDVDQTPFDAIIIGSAENAKVFRKSGNP